MELLASFIGGVIGSAIVLHYMNPNRKKKRKKAPVVVEACAIPHPSTKWL